MKVCKQMRLPEIDLMVVGQGGKRRICVAGRKEVMCTIS